MSRATFPREISRTCRPHGSCRPPGPLGRYCPNAGQPLAAAAAVATHGTRSRPDHPRDDVVASLEPELVRRHVLGRVLVQQRDERLHVVTLEGADIAGEELPLALVHRVERCARVAGGHRRAGPLQRAVDRRVGRLEQLGDLFGAPAQHLTQDEDGALARRQVLQCGDEREPDGVAGDRDVGRVAVGADAVVRHRFDPGAARARLTEQRRQRRRRGRQVDRQRTAFPAAERVEADIRGNAVEPGPERGPAVEAVEAAPGPDHRLLDGVLGVVHRPEHPVAVSGQLAAVPVELQLQGGG